jgi:hypothetical protein
MAISLLSRKTQQLRFQTQRTDEPPGNQLACVPSIAEDSTPDPPVQEALVRRGCGGPHEGNEPLKATGFERARLQPCRNVRLERPAFRPSGIFSIRNLNLPSEAKALVILRGS